MAKDYCYDHIRAKSFFHSLKVERIYGERFTSRAQMRGTVFTTVSGVIERWGILARMLSRLK